MNGNRDPQLFDLIYPVGSIYMSVNSTNPANLFGGTWEQMKDRFLLGAGGSYSVGATGGRTTTRHTSYLPPINSNNDQTAGMNYINAFIERANTYLSGDGSVIGSFRSVEVRDVGGSITSNSSIATEVSQFNYETDNMPPYLAVYMWKRTA